MHSATDQQRRAFSIWLRTGQLPGHLGRPPLERKFNPWHDARNGRFTFAGAGQYFPSHGGSSASGKGQDASRFKFNDDPASPRLTSVEEVDAWAARQRAGEHRKEPGFLEAVEARRQLYKEQLASIVRDSVAKVVEFNNGLATGLYESGKGALTSLYSLVTTNPLTTGQNIEFGIARLVDSALAAEDTPAYVQITRAAHAVANASAHDVGYALGAIVGNVGLAKVPGTITTKVSSANRVAKVGKIVTRSRSSGARFGTATSTNYRAVFFDAHPTLRNKVVVHHAVEKQVLDRFPGTVTESEMHSLENLRGVPVELNSDLHLSKIRTEWNRFYKTFEARGMVPTKEQLLRKATEIDAKYGLHFNPPH
jgi:hypothetical protein